MKKRTKTNLRRGIAGILLSATVLSIGAMAASAHAAETIPETTPPAPTETVTPQYPQTLELSVSVKADADGAALKSLIETKLKEQYKDCPIETVVWPQDANFSEDGAMELTIHYQGGTTAVGTLTVTAVTPTGITFAKTLNPVSSMSAYNKDQAALLAYVNSELTLTNTGDTEYAAAIGAASEVGKASAFTWNDCDSKWVAGGGKTYVFTQVVDEKSVNRSVTVSADNYSVGRLYIDYDEGTVNTTKDMKWSLNRNASSWNSCRDNMPIENSWYDRTVYFYIPGDNFASDSPIASLYIPPKAPKPDVKMELTSTSRTITVENCWDFDNVEFRIGNSSNWHHTKDETYTFEGLSANTNYTVYVRTRSDSGDAMFSDAISAKINTKEAVLTKVDVDYHTANRIGYVNGIATIAPGTGSRTMSGSLNSDNLSRFNSMISTYEDRYNRVEATLLVEQYTENTYNNINTITFSVPMNALKRGIQNADMTMEYQCDFGRVYFTNDELDHFYNKGNSSLYISFQEVASVNGNSNWDWLKTVRKNGAPVYKLSVTGGNKTEGTKTYFLPYTLKNNETISSISVYHVNSKGERSTVNFEYDSTLGGVKFSTAENGYFVIIHDKTSHQDIPFIDVAETYWARDYIQYCYDKGLFKGTSDTTFSPNETISKAEVVALLSRLDNFDGNSSGIRFFSDVKKDDWYAMYAGWAYDKGLVNPGDFNGENTMQRVAIARMLYNYIKKDGIDTDIKTDEVERYSDMGSIAGSARSAVLYLRSQGIMDGTGDNTFSPSNTLTRAEMAAIMYRMTRFLEK